ncbi:MAG: cytochrome d ubiquinol oxidase subunit II, partial [Bacteroidaceae bacterium]|nr:cytochrome d ubiquinol oxidase subunit II [Bacteroidaceae bacterium]
MDYIFLQQYWWFVVSLLGSLLVFLLFVQGGNSHLFTVGNTEEKRAKLIHATGSKWEITFTTLVTFGGAFFASFPLFYSTSFGGAYWVWMIILFSFVLQPVSYEFQGKLGNLMGAKTFHWCMVVNGIVGPLLLGGAVATFFDGSNFVVEKGNLLGFEGVGAISAWANGSHGLDALLDPWNLVLGFAVFFLARVLGLLFYIYHVEDEEIRTTCRSYILKDTVPFLVFFLAFVGRTLFKDGYAVSETGEIYMEPMKYLTNFITLWPLLIVFLLGVVGVLYGIA